MIPSTIIYASGIFTTLLIITMYFKRSWSYWRRRNVPQLNPKFPFGHCDNFLRPSEPTYIKFAKYYAKMKSLGHKHCGFYIATLPYYVPIDPNMIKNIVAKDSDHFMSHGFYYNEKRDPLSLHLFSAEGDQWKDLRCKLSPAFAPGKIKLMFETVKQCALIVKNGFDESCEGGKVNVKKISSRYTLDVIASCAFGIGISDLGLEGEDFRKHARLAIDDYKLTPSFVFKFSCPRLAKFFGMRVLTSKVCKFFEGLVKSTLEYRKGNGFKRNDFLQLLMELTVKEHALTLDEICAQSYVFFLAGFETTSTITAFCMYEIAKNSVIQDKIRLEIESVTKKYDGQVTYEAISEMKYLENVIKETIRMYPTAPLLPRRCTKSYQIPGTNITIDKGTSVIIPVYGLHHDPEYFTEPESFCPERFSDSEGHYVTPYTFLPFGEGPRMCIGLRFAMMEMKTVISIVLRSYKLTLSEGMPRKIPLYKYGSSVLSEKPILLNVQKIINLNN